MFGYYLDLAIRSLKRNKVLTTLMVLTLGLGIGAYITTLTVLTLLSGDPVPQSSARLFYPQIDPGPKDGYVPGQTQPPFAMTYIDAMNLLHARRALRQSAMTSVAVKIGSVNPGSHPSLENTVMTTTDFFAMFDVPFQYGGGWRAEDEESHARVAVIADSLNDRLFGGKNSVGQYVRVNDHDFRIVGVLRHWAPEPRFYAIGAAGPSYGGHDALLMPLQTMRDAGITTPNYNCFTDQDTRNLETTSCMWLEFWVEFSDPADAVGYKAFLANYVHQQISLGRFARPEIAMRDMKHLLRYTGVVPDSVRLEAGVALGFLLVCVINAVGLLLAKCLRRSQEIGVRRALGATRRTIFAQFMVEAGLVGLVGGGLGLVFAEAGLWCIRRRPAEYAFLAHLDLQMFLFTFVVGLIASLIAGLLPAWRACTLAPAPQLKAA
jgi:putative ABC transport system permease protein